jgi:hypothetical protein
VAGISEAKAMAAKRQGAGLARHLGVSPGSERYERIKWGTMRAKGWHPSTQVAPRMREAIRGRENRRSKR